MNFVCEPFLTVSVISIDIIQASCPSLYSFIFNVLSAPPPVVHNELTVRVAFSKIGFLSFD